MERPDSGVACPAVRGCGIDLVHVPSFAAQLEQPGTRLARVFHPSELRRARTRRASTSAEHLAGRWAVKEAWIKAWSQALYGRSPVLRPEQVDFAEIQVQSDPHGRVRLRLVGSVADAAATSLDVDIAQLHRSVHISISHDGDYAMGYCVLACGTHESGGET